MLILALGVYLWRPDRRSGTVTQPLIGYLSVLPAGVAVVVSVVGMGIDW
ncbi:hypothetical protein ACFP2T_36430 [Plantactinospora solaniradicis]|uniref:Uncharacterized protein n=1 Tax=Plantactinospora solaniradicis TaxID=1723736 RepID=A0ABW1KIS1_9ACTN